MNLSHAFCFLVACALVSCKKEESNDIPNTFLNPPVFRFALLNTGGSSLITATTFPLKVYSFNGAQKEYYADLAIHVVPAPNDFMVATRDVATSSSERNVKTFYLETGTDTDTLTLDIRRLPVATADNGGYSYPKVTFNGKNVTAYPSVGSVPEYFLLRK